VYGRIHRSLPVSPIVWAAREITEIGTGLVG
jgi:hypothetical protein